MSDYISRDEVLRVLCDSCSCKYSSACMSGDKCYSYGGITNIPAADVRPVRWIPVTERLPVAREKVLVAYRNGVTIAERDGYVIDPTEMRHYWRGIHGPKHSLHSVTHWMPLPEPPKEES